MNKETFLEELRGCLHVLEDQEQEDILEEYAQHIDMKRQKGLSEEEAIKDFGPVKELAAEILEAYHVKPEFGPKGLAARLPEWKMGKAEKNIRDGHFFRRIYNFAAGKLTAFCHGIRKGFRCFWGKCRIFTGRLMKPWMGKKAWMKDDGEDGRTENEKEENEIIQNKQGLNESMEEQAVMARNAEPKPGIDRKSRLAAKRKNIGEGIGGFFRMAGRGIAALWNWFLKFCTGWICLFWNIGWLLASVLFAAMAMAALAGFGALLILVFEGYPLLGILIISLGGVFCFAALSCGAFSLRIRKIPEQAADSGTH